MISGIFLFSNKGEVLISRLYKADIKRSCSDVFRINVVTNSNVRSPINNFSGVTYFHIRHENMYLVAACKDNVNAALVFEFLYKFLNIGKGYFGKFNDEAVKNNFVLIYELLDEILDFGFPQNSDVETLKMYITTEGIKSEKALKEESSKITIQTTGATSWRRPDLKYRKNEAYLDVIESINLLLSNKGSVLKSDVSGQIIMRTYLSGMPECKLGLNDKVVLEKHSERKHAGKSGGVELDDVQFHQCVKLGRFETDRTVSFIPPDGEFELMRYRTTDNINLPFKLTPAVTEHKTRVEFRIAIKALFADSLFAQNVVVKIPTPPAAAKANISVPVGRAKYASGENAIVWKIPKYQGNSEFILSAEVELGSMVNKKAWVRPPVSLDFQVMMFTSSGLTVQYLKVFEKSNYKSVKWVRYYTKAGSYQIRF